MSGTFFAVVGPSGAGKDTLIEYARGALKDDRRFAFPQRCITRPGDAGGENHMAVSAAQFAEMKNNGAFILDWQAHGLWYGVPSDVSELVTSDISVVVNLSRTAISQAGRRFERVQVVHVTAPPDTLAVRLAARGRENASDIAPRLARQHYAPPPGFPVDRICNDGPVQNAGAELVQLLLTRSAPAAPGATV